MTATSSIFEAEVKLPYGAPNHQLFYFERDTPEEEYTEHELAREQKRSEDFKVTAEPQFIPKETIMGLVENEMKVSESINQSLQEK